MRAAVVQEVNRQARVRWGQVSSVLFMVNKTATWTELYFKRSLWYERWTVYRVRVWERGRQLERGSGDGYKI